MPYTAKAHRFFAMCASKKGRAKARSKCPSMSAAQKMMREGIKGKRKRKKRR